MSFSKGFIRASLTGLVCIGGVLGLAGCGSASPTGSGSVGGADGLAAGGAKSLYVLQVSGTGSSVLQFSATAGGNVAPTSSLLLPSILEPLSVAVDGLGEIYVGGVLAENSIPEVFVYSADASGAASPVRVLNGYSQMSNPQASFIYPLSMTVDASGQLYVLSERNGNSVSVFAPGASGNAAPVRYLNSNEINAVNLYVNLYLFEVAVDSSGDIFVAGDTYLNNVLNGGILFEFGAGASGSSVYPTWILGAPEMAGVGVDAAGNAYIATGGKTIEKFAPGTITPTTTITGSSTGLTGAQDVRVDAAGNIYTMNLVEANSTQSLTMLGFAPTASGNALPGVQLMSSSWNATITGAFALQ